jgi:putative heme-binding domain-containing protein
MRLVLLLLCAPLLLLPAGREGRAIFEGKGKCHTCHSINRKGGGLGPELGMVAVTRTPHALRLALTDPNSEIYPEYFTLVLTTRRGERIEGITLNEDDLSIQLRDRSGAPRSFLKSDLREWHREERSLMPSYASTLSPTELDNLLAYLATLRGAVPPRAPRTREIARISENLGWLTRADRDADERPETLLDALALANGMTVADIGAGLGYYTWRLARRVAPSGKVVAVDLQQAMLDHVAAELKRRGTANVELVLGTQHDPRLSAASFDLIFVANSYHEFADPPAMLAAIHRALRPNGRLVIIEYAKEARGVPVSQLHKMSLEDLRSEIEPAGFRLERILDFLPIHHGLILSPIR